jgi:hypothetical protein
MPTDDPHLMAPGHAPTPFSAAEIRHGCPPGRTIRLLVEPAGEPASVRVVRFLTCDEEGAEQEGQRFSLDGEPLEPATTERTRWEEFQAHASFPLQRTRIERETIETPLGVVRCLRYTVNEGDTIRVFWFDDDRPGMPVKVVTRTGDRVASTMTMTGDSYGGEASP